MPRQSYRGLKPIKALIAAGEYRRANQALLGRHDALLMALNNTTELSERSIIKCRLTLIECRLAATASLMGDFPAADSWFARADKYWEAFDPVTHDRKDREQASHLLRKGMVFDALELLNRTERGFRTLMRFGRTSIPVERLELEHAITLSCKAMAELAINPHSIEAREALVQADQSLRNGNKPFYELDNLLRLIAVTSVVDRRRPGYIARATWINETIVRNPATRLTLIDASCGIFPVKSVLQRLGIARD